MPAYAPVDVYKRQVGDGETLYGICFKIYGNIRHLDDILAVNHLTDENRIIAGQTLVLPDVSGE